MSSREAEGRNLERNAHLETNDPETDERVGSNVCPGCKAPLVQITINVGAGERTLCSCAKCDRRWWQVDGRMTTLDGVIHDLGEPETPRARYRP